jgi:hypothetical protein
VKLAKLTRSRRAASGSSTYNYNIKSWLDVVIRMYPFLECQSHLLGIQTPLPKTVSTHRQKHLVILLGVFAVVNADVNLIGSLRSTSTIQERSQI